MDSLSWPLIIFQAVSPKTMDSLGLLISSKSVIPYFIRNNVLLNFLLKCHSPFWRRTECRQSHLPVCRMMRRRSISFSSVIPRSGGGRSGDNLISRYVGWRDVAQFPSQGSFPVLSDDETSKMSSPVCLVQRCHRSKCLFLQTISL